MRLWLLQQLGCLWSGWTCCGQAEPLPELLPCCSTAKPHGLRNSHKQTGCVWVLPGSSGAPGITKIRIISPKSEDPVSRISPYSLWSGFPHTWLSVAQSLSVSEMTSRSSARSVPPMGHVCSQGSLVFHLLLSKRSSEHGSLWKPRGCKSADEQPWGGVRGLGALSGECLPSPCFVQVLGGREDSVRNRACCHQGWMVKGWGGR